jgi:hypothetical protein
MGGIRKLSVAVLIDGVKGQGDLRSYRGRPRLERYKELVSAWSVCDERGDLIEVERPFENAVPEPPEAGDAGARVAVVGRDLARGRRCCS